MAATINSPVKAIAAAVLGIALGYASAAMADGVAALPGTPLLATVPDGWACDASSVVAIADEVLPVLMCLPVEGGSPIALRKLAGTEVPASLEELLASESEQAAARPTDDVSIAPRLTQFGGRSAVEVATKSHGIAHGVDGSSGPIESIMHHITFAEAGTFYRCELTVSPGLDSDSLRRIFLQFCSSVRHSPTNAPTGHA